MTLKLFRMTRAKIPIGIRLKRVLAMDRHDGRRCRVIRLPGSNGLLDDFCGQHRA